MTSFIKNSIYWMEEQGWKYLEDEYHYYIIKYKLEEIKTYPHALFEKDGLKIWVNFFEKKEYPFSKSAGGRVTGIDWHKYQALRYIYEETRIPVMLAMYSEGEFILRQLTELGKPIRWHRDFCESYKQGRGDCFLTWLHYRGTNDWQRFKKTTKSCYNKKGQSMAVWSINKFDGKIAIQPNLI